MSSVSSDSDEEAAGQVEPLSSVSGFRSGHHGSAWLPLDSTLLVGNGEVADTRNALQRSLSDLGKLHPSVPEMVRFRVGDTLFATNRENLTKDPQSLLFVLANNHYRGNTQRDSADFAPISIPDKDPQVFGMLLNLLRGYPNPIPRDWLDACYNDAVYYGLTETWRRHYPVQTEQAFHFPFSGSRLSSDLVLGVSSNPMSQGKHFTQFTISSGDRVGVGVITLDVCTNRSESTQLESRECAVYWSDGRVTRNMDGEAKSEPTYQFTMPSTIRVYVDLDEGIIKWMLNDEFFVSMMRLPNDRKYLFCVFMSSNAQVSLLQ